MRLLTMQSGWVAVAVAEAGSIILGQAQLPVASEAPGWLSVVIQLGSFGLVAFLIVRGLPMLQKDIQNERAAERADFGKMLVGERADFTAALKAVLADRGQERLDFVAALKVVTDHARAEAQSVRQTAREEVDVLRSTFNQEQRETRQFYAGESAQMRKLYTDAVGAMRTAVHDVRDMASQTVNKANVALEVARVGGTPRGQDGGAA
jgi:hypothetical protein